MNHYTSQTEFEWSIIVTPQEEGQSPFIAVEEPKLSELNSIYTSHKPAIDENGTYQFISMDLSQDELTSWGILNCRVNDEHVQVRF